MCIRDSDKVVFSFSVASGTEAYIEVYEGDGGPSIAEDVAGPTEKSYDVTTTLKFVTTNPENVTLMLAGEAVPTDQMTESGGVYTYTCLLYTSWRATAATSWPSRRLPARWIRSRPS